MQRRTFASCVRFSAYAVIALHVVAEGVGVAAAGCAAQEAVGKATKCLRTDPLAARYASNTVDSRSRLQTPLCHHPFTPPVQSKTDLYVSRGDIF